MSKFYSVEGYVAALTRKYLPFKVLVPEGVEVPSWLLLDLVYSSADETEFLEDPDYWERTDCNIEQINKTDCLKLEEHKGYTFVYSEDKQPTVEPVKTKTTALKNL